MKCYTSCVIQHCNMLKKIMTLEKTKMASHEYNLTIGVFLLNYYQCNF